jgi:hypothetical protein
MPIQPIFCVFFAISNSFVARACNNSRPGGTL